MIQEASDSGGLVMFDVGRVAVVCGVLRRRNHSTQNGLVG